MSTIYMDHHATTPLHPEVLEAMLPFFRGEYGNPASVTHEPGRRAAAAVEEARATIATLAGARPREIVFTSGATESNNLALRGSALRARERSGSAHLITAVIEHKSILDTAADLERQGVAVTVVPVERHGLVDPGRIRDSLRPDTCLVSIQQANSEIGTIQPLDEISRICAEADVPLHTDAVQGFGWLPLEAEERGLSLMSGSAHKIYGPKGVGILRVSRRLRLQPILTGGGHERERRSGTLNVPGIIGMARALEIARAERREETERLRTLRDRLWEELSSRIADVDRNGHPERCLPHNLNVSFRHVEGESLLMALKGFALSSGSACTSTDTRGSYVIRALGAPDEAAHSSIRIGLGRSNTEAQVEQLVEQLVASVVRLRAISTAPA